MMEMMRMMAAQRQQTPPIVPASANTVAPIPAPSFGQAELDVSPDAPPVRSVDTASTERPRWHAQTTWVVDATDSSGLQLVICEDDATEEAEIAEARRKGQTATQLTTLSPSALGPGAIHHTAAAPPCDLLLEVAPSAAIVRVTAIR